MPPARASVASVASAADLPAAELIDLIIARAPALIAAGITSIQIQGLSATLVKPAPPEAPAAKQAKPPAKQHIDPLRDASTYPGGVVPGFTREEERTFG